MLLRTPTISDLARMYYELGKMGASSAGSKERWPYKPKNKEELVALGCDMSRYDPRLFGILVEFFSRHWRWLNPTALRAHYKHMNTPETLGVIGEFLLGMADDQETVFFVHYISAGLKPVPPQFYFFDLYAPGGSLARQAVEEGVYEFKKWGFFAYERPTIDAMRKTKTGSFDPIARRNILKRILEEKGEIGLRDYLEALDYSICRQQALNDIKSSRMAKPYGAGRGARWR